MECAASEVGLIECECLCTFLPNREESRNIKTLNPLCRQMAGNFSNLMCEPAHNLIRE